MPIAYLDEGIICPFSFPHRSAAVHSGKTRPVSPPSVRPGSFVGCTVPFSTYDNMDVVGCRIQGKVTDYGSDPKNVGADHEADYDSHSPSKKRRFWRNRDGNMTGFLQ